MKYILIISSLIFLGGCWGEITPDEFRAIKSECGNRAVVAVWSEMGKAAGRCEDGNEYWAY